MKYVRNRQQTGRQTKRQTDRRDNIMCLPFTVGERIKNRNVHAEHMSAMYSYKTSMTK